MILLLPITGHCTLLTNTVVNDTIPKREVIKALYKCDSLNTLLSKNLSLASKKDSLQSRQIDYLANKVAKSGKVKFKSHAKTATITAVVLVLAKIIFNI